MGASKTKWEKTDVRAANSAWLRNLNNIVSLDFCRFKNVHAVKAELCPNGRVSFLSRDNIKSLKNRDTSGSEIRAATLACSEGLLNRVPHCITPPCTAARRFNANRHL